jgi:bifunctional DNA-binding transcriptional regulator/antitoxin component of YhaV-PrlF toxin-antitoxin module
VVAIRDGKLATETVRQSTRVGAPNGEAAIGDTVQEVEEDIYEELVVLDSAGRLQVPKEYLEQFGISLRARLDITEEGILIRPAPEAAQRVVDQLASQASATFKRKSRRGLLDLSKVGNLFGRGRRGRRGSDQE